MVIMILRTKNKQGQMKIQQMAFMLMAVTLFFVLAGLFIITIRFSGLKQSAEALDEKNALLLVSKVADSPEFSCGSAFGEPKTNCIDTDKVMALKPYIDKYSGFWGVDGLEIRKVYPGGEETGTECTAENYPDCGKIMLVAAGSGTGVSNFVSLCRKENMENGIIYDKCEIGRIIVTYNGK